MTKTQKMATVKIGDTTADLTDGGWVCDDKDFQNVLNAFKFETAPGYHPNRWLAHAEFIAGMFDGKVTWYQELEYEEGRVY